MNDIWDGVQLALSAYKDSLSKDLLQQFKESYYLTLNAEADSRRSKVSTDIKNMAKLRIELKKFEYTYQLVKEKTGDIGEVEKMIRQLENQIDKLKASKNNAMNRR